MWADIQGVICEIQCDTCHDITNTGWYKHHRTHPRVGLPHKWGLWYQKQVSWAGISQSISQDSVRCNYLSMPEIPVSGTKVLIWFLPWVLDAGEFGIWSQKYSIFVLWRHNCARGRSKWNIFNWILVIYKFITQYFVYHGLTYRVIHMLW